MESTITIEEIDIQVIRKNIKNFNFSIYPLEGRVRVSAPRHVTDTHLRHVILSKLDWIRKKQHCLEQRLPQPELQYLNDEQHFVFGRPYRLEVIQTNGRQKVILNNTGKLTLFVKPGATFVAKEKLLNNYYRHELKQRVPDLIEKWQPIMGKDVRFFGIKKMKTRWGTCNTHKHRIWLNLELAKKPEVCLEYVLVHEMVHLLERNHSKRFYALMDHYLPEWRERKSLLER